MKKAIINARLFTGASVLERKVLVIENQKILAITDEVPTAADTELIDLAGQNISAGLIDIQINGGYTTYFSQHPGEQTLLDIDQACREHGTLYYLPTLISSRIETIITAIDEIRDFQTKYPEKGILGMHLEGPFFNPLKRGAHSKNIVRNPTDEELKRIVTHSKGIIKVMTIAPELFSFEQIRYLQDSGIQLAAGHSNMSYEQAMTYFDQGIQLATHLYNAMPAFGHRSPGLIGATLEHKDVYASIILDGHHLHYAAARLAKVLKGDHLFLITDSSFLGRRMQNFEWDDFDASLQDGTYRNKEGNLAGAAISMPEAVKNAHLQLQVSLQQAIEMATSHVANAIHMQDKLGYIRPGYPARFFVFNQDLTQYSTLIL